MSKKLFSFCSNEPDHLFCNLRKNWQRENAALISIGYRKVGRLMSKGVIFCSAIECLDAQILFDPFEEEFDVPATFVNVCDSYGGQTKVIGYEDKAFTGLGINETNATQLFRIVSFTFGRLQADGLITAKSSFFVDRTRLADIKCHIAFGTCYEKGPCLMDAIKP